MDYPFENLGPEKFQLFCQALLVREYPGVQCFPVAQPDGGRDATQMYFNRGRGKEFAVFQVKFSRNPLSETDPHKWLTNIMSEEAPKIKKQIRTGAKFFALMTNIPGTAHLDSGSIDKINELLTSQLGIRSICLWRNDLSRRLDGIWDLKWTYPELMTGPDLIRFVIEGNLSESKGRRASAVRAFVTNQFTTDQYVKFKQVDLDNRLMDLFIDVPIGSAFEGRWRKQTQRRVIYAYRNSTDYWGSGHDEHEEYFSLPELRPEFTHRSRQKTIGAATFLLGRALPPEYFFVVIEGAPGQGKSTITQYLCQVHRMRLLGKETELLQVPENHRETSLRLPIKVDLRDFSVWLGRRNPFTAEAEEIPNQLWDRSLESFLAALIRSQSGGAQFDVSDLHAIAELSSILLVLDGLDEVADIKRRAEVVAEITKGSERLQSISASLQVVVTSRPAAFENSPGLPEDKFSYVSLESVTQELIDEYAGKWLKARRLDERESSEVRRILREKLNQPHLRDLARNPMQLAILLSLIHTRGVSLPDKRTALYDSYVELFFNRESEKSIIVRENRDLLIDIHRYLAWLLHVESEQADGIGGSQPTGAIEETRLKSVLKDYLTSEGRDPQLAGELFTGLIERVVALVSRVEGTYEFEVQPLREYFAARFLHETAPYSPVGDEKCGTRPDRFDAIARNFYWLNVTRFYAGCYSKGELASLIDRLGELICDSEFRHLSHPRILGATLLGDWVFTQHPKSVSEVVRLVLDGLGLRFLLTSTNRRQSHSQPLILPIECGKAELVEKCFSMLRQIPPMDYALDVLDLLGANTTREQVIGRWKSETQAVSKSKRTAWLEYGLHLGCVPTLELQDLENLLLDNDLNAERIGILLKSRRSDFFESNRKYENAVINALLDRRVEINLNIRKSSAIEIFGQAIDPTRYAFSFRESPALPLSEIFKRHSSTGSWNLSLETFQNANWNSIEACREVVRAGIESESVDSSTWASSLDPWEKLVATISTNFGERWSVRQLANVASGIKSASETCTDSPDLHDSKRPICRRARYARLRAGTPTWWSKQLNESTDTDQKLFSCLLYFTWASPNTVFQTVEIADKFVASFSLTEWPLLFTLVEQACDLARPQARDRHTEFPETEEQFSSLSSRTLALLRLRARPVTAIRLYEEWLKRNEDDIQILRAFQSDAINQLLTRAGNAKEHLNVLESGYKAGVLSERFSFQLYSRKKLFQNIPIKLAVEIVEHADRFPNFLVSAAEGRCRAEAAKNIRPVGKIAEEEGWFKLQ